MGSQTLEQRRVTERLALRDPRLFEEHRSQRVLHAVSVEVRRCWVNESRAALLASKAAEISDC